MNLTKEDIENAYRKLKSYYYYDNQSLFYRRDIAEFECNPNFDDSLNNLLENLNKDEIDSEYINNLIKETDIYCVPKKFKEIGRW